MQHIKNMQCTELTGLVSVTPFFTGSTHPINERQRQPLHGPFWPSNFCRMAHRVWPAISKLIAPESCVVTAPRPIQLRGLCLFA